MSHVFISYSKSDRSIAQALADDLMALGLPVWWDFELYAGDDFHDAILAAIDAATAVIVIWSPTARTSHWVRSEASRAQRQQKLIPTLAPGAALEHVPLPFDQLQCVSVLEREQIYRSLQRLGVVSIPTHATPPASPVKLPTSRQDLEEDIAGYLLLVAKAVPKRIADIDSISEIIELVTSGPEALRTGNKVRALAELQTLSRMPDIDQQTRLHIEHLLTLVYHIDSDLPPRRPPKPFIKRPLHSIRQTPPDADFRDLIDIAALGDAINRSTAEVMFRAFQEQTLLKQPSDMHGDLKADFEDLRTRYRLNKNFRKALDLWLDNFERDLKHRNHEGHRLSDFLKAERQGKAYLFLVHMARRRRFVTD